MSLADIDGRNIQAEKKVKKKKSLEVIKMYLLPLTVNEELRM